MRTELRRLFALALPLAAAEAGTQIMSVVDMAVIGRLGGLELAAAGLGNAVFFGVAVFGLGLMLGVDGRRERIQPHGGYRAGFWRPRVAAVVRSLAGDSSTRRGRRGDFHRELSVCATGNRRGCRRPYRDARGSGLLAEMERGGYPS